MTKEIENFISENLELIDNDEWEALLDNMQAYLPNPLIYVCIKYLQEAGIDLDKFQTLRIDRIFKKLNLILSNIKPSIYGITSVIPKIAIYDRYGFDSQSLLKIIYNNSELLPSNVHIEDSDYDEARRLGYYNLIVR